MLTGQIYYYNKMLDLVPDNLQFRDLDKIELMGVPPLDLKNFIGLDTLEIKAKIRGLFQEGYLNILMESGHPKVAGFWADLTSPELILEQIQNNNLGGLYTSGFTEAVETWVKNGAKLNDLEPILKDGELQSGEVDLLLFYGLKTLYKFSSHIPTGKTNSNSPTLSLKDDQETEMSQNPEILIICSQIFAPLFLNLNCQFLDFISDEKLLLTEVRAVLVGNPSINLILIEAPNSAEVVASLIRQLPPNLLITSINLNPTPTTSTLSNVPVVNNTFFDHLVKKTLGVKLT